MLPFMKHKPVAGILTKMRKPDEITDEPSDYHELEGCCEDLLRAIDQKDARAMAQAFKDAIDCAASYPSQDDKESDFDTRNADAATER